jgi:hypothetical protein
MMGFADLLVTPILLLLVYFLAVLVKKRVSTEESSVYFIPGLMIKVGGALSLGIIYQFYYGGGDTFNYYQQGTLLYDLFFRAPLSFFKLYFFHQPVDEHIAPLLPYLYWWNAPSEMFVVRMSALLGLICFNTYSSIAVLFAVISFSGLWAMYTAFVRLFPGTEKTMAIAVFFVPSVFFWGSGLMKDTLGIGALGWLIYGFYFLFVEKRNIIGASLAILLSVWLLFQVRVYILLSFLPPALFWIILENNRMIRNKVLRWLLKPAFIGLGVLSAYVGSQITSGHRKYDLEKIGQLTKINAEYLYSQSVLEGGSAYYLGELDGSLSSMLSLAPSALVVSLFRPYIWEVRNPIMLISALESLFLLLLLLYCLIKVGPWQFFILALGRPFLLFCFSFTILFAIAVGLNSFNFGTLVRYKIPFLPLYTCGLLMMLEYVKLKKDMAIPS